MGRNRISKSGPHITTQEHPLGVYHPHAELHHIKKENIGLIEVMGLAVLPARLRDELGLVAEGLAQGADLRANELTAKHADWALFVSNHMPPRNFRKRSFPWGVRAYTPQCSSTWANTLPVSALTMSRALSRVIP